MSYDCYVLCSLQGSVDARFISAKKSILYSVVPHLIHECESKDGGNCASWLAHENSRMGSLDSRRVFR